MSPGDNGYGQPTPRLLDLLESTRATGFRTDESGMIVIAPQPDSDSRDGDAMTEWTARLVGSGYLGTTR